MSSATEADDTFARLLGRQPSDAERARVNRIRDVLGIRSNDALWHVVLCLEQYDLEYRQYPALLAKETEKALQGVRGTVQHVVQDEVRQAHASLAAALAETTRQLAERRAARGGAIALGYAFFAVSLLCGLCVLAGFVLATGHAPGWYEPRGARFAMNLLHYILGAPAGWLAVVAAAVVVPVWWVRKGVTKAPWYEWAGIAALIVAGVGTLLTFAA